MRFYRPALAIIVFSIGLSRSAHCQTSAQAAPGDSQLKLVTERVVVFKDGHGLFIKSGSGVADALGRVISREVPDAAVLGCVWATSADGKVLGLRAETADQHEVLKRSSVCVSTLDLLRANQGKDAELGMTSGTSVSGKLLGVLDASPEPPAGPVDRTSRSDAASVGFSHLSSAPSTEGARPITEVRDLSPKGAQLVVLQERDGRKLVLPVADVKTIETKGDDLVTSTDLSEETTTHGKQLVFEFGKEAAGKPVSLHFFYFTEGVRWIPTYRVFGNFKDTAELALQGEVVNECEDVEGAALDLVVGVPNFRFKNVVSPLSLERTMRNALAVAAPDLSNQFMSNAIQSQALERRAPEAAAPSGVNVMESAPELGAESQQDMFVYGVKDFSLKKGARAAVALWNTNVPLHNVYTFDVNVKRNPHSGSASVSARRDLSASGAPSASPLELENEKVWHQLELTNTTQVPWTTGAGLIMKGTLPLAQDMLTYTSPGGTTLLPVTVAVDLRGTQEEEETGRQPNALRWGDQDFARVEKKGKLTITSFRKEPSDIRIKVSFGGKAGTASDNGKITVDDYQAQDWNETPSGPVNNHSEISWRLTLDPGQTKTVEYTGSYFVR